MTLEEMLNTLGGVVLLEDIRGCPLIAQSVPLTSLQSVPTHDITAEVPQVRQVFSPARVFKKGLWLSGVFGGFALNVPVTMFQ